MKLQPEHEKLECGCVFNWNDKFVEEMCDKHQAAADEAEWDAEARYLDSM